MIFELESFTLRYEASKERESIHIPHVGTRSWTTSKSSYSLIMNTRQNHALGFWVKVDPISAAPEALLLPGGGLCLFQYELNKMGWCNDSARWRHVLMLAAPLLPRASYAPPSVVPGATRLNVHRYVLKPTIVRHALELFLSGLSHTQEIYPWCALKQFI